MRHYMPLLLVLVAAGLNGCTFKINKPITDAQRAALATGITTVSDALLTLGQPTERTDEKRNGSNFVQLIYMFGDVTPIKNQANLRLLIVEFRDDKMIGSAFFRDDEIAAAKFIDDSKNKSWSAMAGVKLDEMPPPNGAFACPVLASNCAIGDRLLVWGKLAEKSFLRLVVSDAGEIRQRL